MDANEVAAAESFKNVRRLNISAFSRLRMLNYPLVIPRSKATRTLQFLGIANLQMDGTPKNRRSISREFKCGVHFTIEGKGNLKFSKAIAE